MLWNRHYSYQRVIESSFELGPSSVHGSKHEERTHVLGRSDEEVARHKSDCTEKAFSWPT